MNKISKSQTLKVVDVRGCNDGSGVSDSAIRYLTRIPTLEELYFRFEISDAGVEHLKNSQTLKFVELQDCDMLTDAAVASLVSHPSLTGLRIFRCKSYGDEGVKGLASMKLERLELRDLNVGNDGILGLKDMGVETLKTVELSELTSVDEAGLNELLAAWKSPTSLSLFSMPATDETVKTIVASMPELKTLTLRAVQITDAAIDELVKLENLETLDLRANAGLTVEGMMKLTQAPNLRRIYVKETAFGHADAAAKVDEFKKAKPKCAIVL
jgi:Leucine-rich repeat (LRR) protein